jgi:hypothetical protein
MSSSANLENLLDRIIIEPERYPDGSLVYNAYCPTLDLADYGDTIELRLEVLRKEGEEIPVDLPNGLVTHLSVEAPKGARLAIS